MSSKLPAVTGQELAPIAERLGFEFRRQTGSHAIYLRASDQRRVVIPTHAGRDLKGEDLAGHRSRPGSERGGIPQNALKTGT
jgi:predicted RNA binding protein YcfA (HicA-like mRNA interferase family)